MRYSKWAEEPFTLGVEGHFRASPVMFDGINGGTAHGISTVPSDITTDPGTDSQSKRKGQEF
jgi:hypothetical protein